MFVLFTMIGIQTTQLFLDVEYDSNKIPCVDSSTILSNIKVSNGI